MNNEELKEDLKKEFEKFHDECGMDGNPEMISDWWLQKLSLREQELWDKIEKMKRKVPSAGDYPGPEAINIGSRMGYNFACSDIQTLLKSNLKGGVDCENMI